MGGPPPPWSRTARKMRRTVRSSASRAGWLQPTGPGAGSTPVRGPYVPAPISGTRISRWWAWAPVLSLGVLSFLPFLRIAIARKRRREWTVFAIYLAANIALLAVIEAGPKKAPSPLGAIDFLLMTVATVHALIEFRSLPAAPPNLALPPAYPGYDPVTAARARIQRREEARKLAERDPVLARELRIGRPDLPRQFDDGGLVDVNSVPAPVLAQHLQLTPQEVDAVLSARDQLGTFTSPDEFSVYAQLAPARVDAIRDLLWFG